VLPEGLRAAGAVVDDPVAYRTLPAAVDAAALRAELVSGRLAALTFTSPSAVRHFAALLDAPALEAARRCAVAAIGSVTAAALARAGLPADAIAAEPDPRALVEALCQHVAGAGQDR
jgi:uroporphyrinogen-III synthase